MSEVSKVADCVTIHVFGNGRAEDAFDVGQRVVLTQVGWVNLLILHRYFAPNQMLKVIKTFC